MAAKWDIDQQLYIPAKVVEVVVDETGVTYQVKVNAKDKMTNLYFEEDELVEDTP